MHALLEVVLLVAVVVAVAAAARRFGLLAPIMLVVVGLGLSFVPGFPVPELSTRVRDRRDPAAAAVRGGTGDLGAGVPVQPAADPAARRRARAVHRRRWSGFAVHAIAAGRTAGHLLRPRRGRRAAGRDRGHRGGPPDRPAPPGGDRSSRARACSTTRPRWCCSGWPSLAAIGTAIGPLDIATGDPRGGRRWPAGRGGRRRCPAVPAPAHDRPAAGQRLSLLTPFVVAVAAEEIHGSGVVAVVVTGLYLGHRMPTLMSAASRLQMHAFWQMVQFLLEGLVFLVVGLQLRDIVADAGLRARRGRAGHRRGAAHRDRGSVRLGLPGHLHARGGSRAIRRRDPSPPWSVPTVIGWAGMRGVVTLATALALPRDAGRRRAVPARRCSSGSPSPSSSARWCCRALTLPYVARLVNPPADDPTKDHLAEAQIQNRASRAALATLERARRQRPAGGGRAAAAAHRGSGERGLGTAGRRTGRRRRRRTSGCGGR